MRNCHLYINMYTDNGKEILSMDVVLSYLIKANRPLITKEELARLVDHTPHQWADFVDTIRGSVITNPGMVCVLVGGEVGCYC